MDESEVVASQLFMGILFLLIVCSMEDMKWIQKYYEVFSIAAVLWVISLRWSFNLRSFFHKESDVVLQWICRPSDWENCFSYLVSLNMSLDRFFSKPGIKLFTVDEFDEIVVSSLFLKLSILMNSLSLSNFN